jgi:hypothetical protein
MLRRCADGKNCCGKRRQTGNQQTRSRHDRSLIPRANWRFLRRQPTSKILCRDSSTVVPTMGKDVRRGASLAVQMIDSVARSLAVGRRRMANDRGRQIGTITLLFVDLSVSAELSHDASEQSISFRASTATSQPRIASPLTRECPPVSCGTEAHGIMTDRTAVVYELSVAALRTESGRDWPLADTCRPVGPALGPATESPRLRDGSVIAVQSHRALASARDQARRSGVLRAARHLLRGGDVLGDPPGVAADAVDRF